MTAFCGTFAGQDTWVHWTVNPCILESVSSVLLICIAALVLYFQGRRIMLLRKRQHQGSERTPACAIAFYFSIVALAASHGALLIAAIVYYIRGASRDPYELFNQSASAVVWLCALVVLYVGYRRRIAVQLKLLLWPAALAYALEVYTWALMLAGNWGIQSSVSLVYLVLATIQLLAILVAASISPFMKPPHEEDEMLKQALLGADVEAPGGKKKKRPWYELMWTATVYVCLRRLRSRYELMWTAIVYVWPKTPILQFRACLCVVLLAIMRLLNLAVPVLYRNMVNKLSDAAIAASSGGAAGWQPTFWNVFYPVVFLYMLLSFFQGGAGTGSSGMLNNARSYLWIPIGQNAFRAISVDMFQKAMDLDLRWHLMRKTGEVTRIMDRGTSSIQQVLSTVLFNIVPQLFDVVAACIFISAELQVWIAIIVLITLGSYVPLTVILTELRVKYRRDMNQYDNARGARVTDALLNYETVKVFGNEEYERNALDECIVNYQDVEYKLMSSLNGLNVLQSIIIFSGLIAGLMVCVKGVAEGRLTVGDAVLFITLMQQLYAPLNYFGSYYRTIQRQLIDMENCFELLATNAGLTDKPDAKDIVASKCSIEFRDVSFSYVPDSPVIKDVSFTCPGGQTLALVGATGSGKSSGLRLIFRFYDPTSGAVFMDGQNIADVTQASLRSHMGFVPQDSVLFNDTILHNIRYGRPDATDEEVHEAAKAASIHDSIVGRFPQQYDTIVGERGLRLSGGEKQRVAFARAILKNPRVLLLDEATSSLDSLTERRIQERLNTLRSGQTTIIVAHRLSTVMDADIIIVMQEGTIAEQGKHSELIQRGGLYAEMWQRQAEAAAIEEVVAPDDAVSGMPDSRIASEISLSNGFSHGQ